MARKSKGFRSLLKQKKTESIREQTLNGFEQKFQHSEIADSFTDIVKNPQGEIKMSEVLEEFVEPYLLEAIGLNKRKMLFEIAIIAWNLAIMSEEQRKSALEELIGDILKNQKTIAKQDLNSILNEMVSRKLQLFPTNRRYIVDFQLEDIGNQFHLSVASTLAPQS